ncbi:MFS transporter [Candidimonas nitroreducens]|uniref:MFS transporter n=1 Tax=Candidimonas nitroreducens TaxID=683354 RepID=A0A225MJ91_9BURK|nr:MFS transporter [Candidimonas nitroreducens]
MKTSFTRAILAVAVFVVSLSAAGAQFPERPIRLLVGFSAGGSTDAIARYYATALAGVLKQPVIVDNRPGALQLVAIRALMGSHPDGYTLFLASGSAMSQGPGVRSDLPYDPLKDFTSIALVGTAAGVVVCTPSFPAKNIDELIAYAKQRPGALNYGSSGVGSASNLQTELLSNLAGIKMTHIPYKADAQIMTAIMEGSVQIGLSPVQGAMPLVTSGRVRALAVTGSKRVPQLPNVPTLSEAKAPGLGRVDPYTYYALVGPKNLPGAVVEKLNSAVRQVAVMPKTVEFMNSQGYEIFNGSPAALQDFVQADTKKWKDFSKKSGLGK